MPYTPRPDFGDMDISTLSSWGVRVALASMGWRTEVSLSMERDDRLHCGIWLTHSAWHGTLSEVKLHTQWFPQDDNAVEDITESLRCMALRAVKAWDDYPDSVPCQIPDGLAVHTSETEYFKNYPSARVVVPERSCPTEKLPGWPGQPSIEEFLDVGRLDGNAWLEHALAFVREGKENGAKWNDGINPWAIPNAWQYEERVWQYEAKPWISRWDGKIVTVVDFPLKSKTVLLNPLGAEMLTRGMTDTLRQIRFIYPPDVLPAGMKYHVHKVYVQEDDEEDNSAKLPSP